MTRKIAFVGTCQTTGMAAVARALLGDAWEVEGHHIGAQLDAEAILQRITGYDVIVTQVRVEDRPNAALFMNELQGKAGQIIEMPPFVFTGLHPDMTYVFNAGGVVAGYHSDMHSLIALAAFLLDLPVRRAVSLYNTYIFAEIGYFDAYASSYQVMLAQFDGAGYNLRGMPERWMADSGPFMYTINHPSIAVLGHMAVLALARAGILSVDAQAPSGIIDNLHEAFCAPLFPGLARRLGFGGSTDYLRPLYLGADRQISLAEYVLQSYAIYQDVGREVLASDQVMLVRDKLAQLLARC